MRKKDEAIDGGSEWSAPTGGRVTPLDVQQKEFRVTRVGSGYRMREVDEFLDQITDTLTALVAENDRLRTSGGAVAAAPAGKPGPSTTPSRTDPGAVDAFLQREKGFLQDLGGLVQAHAEELRSMIRAARSGPSVSDTPTEPEAPMAQIATAAPVATPVEESIVEAEPVATGEPTASDEIEQPTEPPASAVEDERDPGTITRVVADEPIRIEEPEPEPQPARSGRSDEKEGDSLRELFWGEE
jgi:DivIVA domain-containing protein